MILYYTDYILYCILNLKHFFVKWGGGYSTLCDLQDHLRSKMGLRMESEHQKTMIWYLTWLFFIYFIFWPLEVIDIWSSQPPGLSEIKKRSKNAIRTPKKTFELIPNITHLIEYFDLFWGRYRREAKLEVGYMCQYQHMIMG